MEPVVHKTKKQRKEDKPVDGASTDDDQTSQKPESSKEKVSNLQVATENASFKVISQTQMFVDRTALLGQLLVSKRKFVLTAPRRMGKSTMIDMVKTFMERDSRLIEKTLEDGEVKNPNYKYFENLEIAKNVQFMNDHFGNYPVIHVCFPIRMITSKENALAVLREAIHLAYERHYYLRKFLMDDPNAREEYITRLNQWLKDEYEDLSETKVRKGLRELAEILHYAYKQKCWVLVDEYDSIINSALSMPMKDLDFLEICDVVIGSVSQVVKGPESEDYVFGSIITGITYLARYGLSDGMNNIDHFPFLEEHRFNDFFRLNEDQVSKLLEKFELQHQQVKVRDHYNGYKGEDGKSFYNPYSIFQYLDKRTFKDCWVTSGTIKGLKQFLQLPTLKKKIQSMIVRDAVEFKYVSKITQQNLNDLHSLMASEFLDQIKNKKMSDADDVNGRTDMTDIILSYFLDQGYFTIFKNLGNFRYQITVPNEEVADALRTDLKAYYQI